MVDKPFQKMSLTLIAIGVVMGFWSIEVRAEVPRIPCAESGIERELCQQCNEGTGATCRELGLRLQERERTVVEPSPRGGRLLLIGCHHGDGLSCFHAGRLASGDRAIQLFELGCEQGSADSCAMIAHSHRRLGRLHSFSSSEATKALGLYRRACEDGSASACTELGRYYWHSSDDSVHAKSWTGSRQEDLRTSLHFHRRACELGGRPSCRVLRPEQPTVGMRLFPNVSVGAVGDFGSSNGARFTTDVAGGIRQRLYRFPLRPSALQIVPDAGYTYSKDHPHGDHWGFLGIGLRYTTDEERDIFAVTIGSAFLVRSFEDRLFGLRTFLRLGIYFESLYISLDHEWTGIAHDDNHSLRVMFSWNLAAFVFAVIED